MLADPLSLLALALWPVALFLGCCCGGGDCPICEGEECCGDDWPRSIGECCDDVWYTEEGDCCGGVWYPADEEGECCGDVWYTTEGECCGDYPNEVWVAEGEGECCGDEVIPAGTEGECCGDVWREGAGECCNDNWYESEGICCTDQNGDDLFWIPNGIECPDPDSVQRCCTGPPFSTCSYAAQEDCENGGGVSLPGRCDELGCPATCCTEDESGDVSCADFIDEFICEGTAYAEPCNMNPCVGACCDEEGNNLGQLTQEECSSEDGFFAGLGSTTCYTGCRDPYTSECCENVASAGLGLTLTQPRRKRIPPITQSRRVTVTGFTDSPVLVHGTPFGVEADPVKRCPINHTFVICWDKFNIEPVPCETEFRYINVDVCWSEEVTDTELLNFSGCNDITVWLGYCENGCRTTLYYDGIGAESNVIIVMHGDAFIQAEGGPLVLTETIQHEENCGRKLTLTGTSDENNEIRIIPDHGANVTTVDKDGSGRWRMNGASTYSGKLRVLSGTLVLASEVAASGGSPFGTSTQIADLPEVGSDESGASLLADGVLVDRGFTVMAGTGVVRIGEVGAGTSTFATSKTIRLGRDITLQAGAGGTAIFRSVWQDETGGASPAVKFTIGSSGNTGTVVLGSFLPDSITAVDVLYGTAILDGGQDTIAPETPVLVAASTLEIDATDSQSLESLTLTSGSTVTGGTLRLPSGATVTSTGIDDISADVALDGDATFEVGNQLEITGDISGTGGLVKSDGGTLEIAEPVGTSGSLSVTDGTVVINKIVSGPAGLVTSATFTPTTLTIAFSGNPAAADEFQLLTGATVQSYASVTLTGTTATGTYDSATSTLTID